MKMLSQLLDFLLAPAGTYDSDSGLYPAANDDDFGHELTVVNPATGLCMTDGIGSLDTAGNPFCVDFSQHDDAGFENDACTYGHDGGSAFGHDIFSVDAGFSQVDGGINLD